MFNNGEQNPNFVHQAGCPVAAMFQMGEHNPNYVLQAGCPVAAMFHDGKRIPNFEQQVGHPVAAKWKIKSSCKDPKIAAPPTNLTETCLGQAAGSKL